MNAGRTGWHKVQVLNSLKALLDVLLDLFWILCFSQYFQHVRIRDKVEAGELLPENNTQLSLKMERRSAFG